MSEELKYQKILRSIGLRATPLRMALLEYLECHHGPFTARELYEKLGRSSNLTTVYRAAESFVEKGIATQCDFGDGLVRYELSCDHGSHHHHLICTSCRRWLKVDICIEGNSAKELEKTGFKEITHKLEFFGKCPECY